MRIVELTETLTAGGAETFVVRLSNALVQAGHQVLLAVMVPNIHPAVAAAIDPRVQIELVPPRGWRWWWRAEKAMRLAGMRLRPQHARQRRWLSRLVEEFRPSVIHSHLLKADLLAMDVRKSRPSIGHMLTVHGDYPMFLEGKSDPFLLDLERHVSEVARSASAIVGVAEPHLTLFRERFGVELDRLHLIYNGLEQPASDGPSRADLGLPETAFIFGMVARGIEGKGWRPAIEAFRCLDRRDAVLVLVGEGPFLDTLKAEGQADNVIFAGFAARPVDWIRHFNVGLMPSQIPHESLPTVIIEYLACGKPVIATNVGEVTAMIRAPDGSLAGQLVPQRSVEALAKAMRQVLEDTALRTRQSVTARAAFAKFAMVACLERYERLLTYVSSNSSSNARH
ncbi:glycosyltransferase family 4 protein [Sphingomonas sp. HDW15A]|uniref:glycosyltransferase family 4 protein n=1 Tax=Sphingomonas sp. HDW15A TaxID=2714942 RepID=UPI00140A9EFC|nr:glycosyltransferase family 4 protein [Sphingomonas sp. HDW15A]QIK95835.1 glycosyltransferase family 4 protein [Sphingomonas sp. HDW15A]